MNYTLPVNRLNLEALIHEMPATIPSAQYPGHDANLWVRKEGDVYFAWYFVVGEDLADFGESAKTAKSALCKLAKSIHRAGLFTNYSTNR